MFRACDFNKFVHMALAAVRGGRTGEEANGRFLGRRRNRGEPGTGLAREREPAQVPGDRAKDRTDKIRATASYQGVLGGGEEFTGPLTCNQFEIECQCHGCFPE